MEVAADTKQITRYSTTSTPILDGLRPLPPRKRLRLGAGEYFFLSGSLILTLIGLPLLRRTAESLLFLGLIPAALIACLAIPAAALAAAMSAHEAGHLLAGRLAGFRLGSRISSPGRNHASEKPYTRDILRVGVWSLEPRKLDQLRRRLGFLVWGGPLASFLLPLVLEACVAAATPPLPAHFAVHVFTAVSILLGIAELLPDTGKGNSSDGARLLTLLRNDAACARWLSIIQLQLAWERGEHPRTWDEAKVAAAMAIDDDSRDAVAARWLGYLWAAERQDITSATKYLEEALAAPEASSAWLRDRLFLEAAVFQAWFRDDLEKAQFWVKQIRRRKLAPAQRFRLGIALLWAEGKLLEAWERLGLYLVWLRNSPASAAGELAENSALEWKAQMESRMLTRAWRTLYSASQEVELAAVTTEKSPEIASW